MSDTTKITAEELAEQTGSDVRFVSIIWTNSTTDPDARPRLVVGGEMSDFEAAALLRAAATRLEDDCAENIYIDGLEDEEEE